MPYRNIEDARAQKRRWNKTPLAKKIRHRFKISKKGKAGSLRYRRKQREICLSFYGGTPSKCACCGETQMEFLTIDHINGGGRQHRLQPGVGGGWNFYRWLRLQGFPAGYRVLCFNCNAAFGMFGFCPHKGLTD